jgi:hypothetical protein
MLLPLPMSCLDSFSFYFFFDGFGQTCQGLLLENSQTRSVVFQKRIVWTPAVAED